MKTVKDMTIAILKTGMKESDLAKLVDTSQPTINRIKLGKIDDPGYTLGKSIEKIYLEIAGEKAA